MSGSHYLMDGKRQFADQFEADGSDFLYRKSLRGPPVRVTAAERGSFIEAFDRGYRNRVRALTAAMIALAAALVAYSTATGAAPQKSSIYLGMGFLLIVFMLSWYRLWNAPAVALERRAPLAGERPRSEVRRILLSKMSWAQFVAIFLFLLVMGLANLPDDRSRMTGEDWIILTVTGGGLLVWIVAAAMKWRAGSNAPFEASNIGR